MRATQDAQRGGAAPSALGSEVGTSCVGARLIAFASAAAAMHALAAMEAGSEVDEEALLALLRRREVDR